MKTPAKPEQIRYRAIDRPNIGVPVEYPIIPGDVYRGRLGRIQTLMGQKQADAIVIYGDREHFATFAWLTGIEPRFEEAIGIITPSQPPSVLLGNECLSLAGWTPAVLRAIHWPSLSLLGQPRSGIRPLTDLLRDAGIRNGQRIGLAGWKFFQKEEFSDPQHTFETPAYLVEALRHISGGSDRVVNATSWFMSPEEGVRNESEPAQIAQFEFAAALASDGVDRLLLSLTPGMSELELAENLRTRGLPLSCHPMVSTGEKARFGLTSPGNSVVKRGDAFTTALGICGGLSCRAGYVAETPADLQATTKLWVDDLAKPFFAGVAAWYQALRIGLSGGELFDLMESVIPPARFGWSLNPGHLLAMDEWTSSPVYPGSTICFRSGMAVQMDIIPAPPEGYCGGNVEDGVVLADEELRIRLASQYSAAYTRIQQRRRFMAETLGIRLDESVLPLSSIPALWHPLLLDKHRALTLA